MPITDDNFTAEELTAVLEKKPELIGQIKPVLATRKFIVHDETEHANYLKTVVEPKIVGEANKKFHDNLDKDVKELFGEDKVAADEKSYVYLKRVAGAKMKVLGEMQTELDKLKKGHNPSEADKLRIAELEKGLQDKATEYDTELKKRDTVINKMKGTSAVEKELAPLRAKFKDNLPKAIVDNFEAGVIEDIVSKIRFKEDGGAVLYDGDKLLTDPKTLLPLTVTQYLTEKLGDLIDTGKGGAGAGGNGQGGKNDKKDGERTEFTAVPGDVKTKLALSDYLLKLGYIDGSKEFDEILEKHGKDLPLR